MVCKREKLNRQMYRSKEDIFCHMVKVTGDIDCEVDAPLLNALHATNTIYDHPEGILRAARLLEQRERALDMQESQGMPAEKITDGETVKHQMEPEVETPSISRLEFSYKKEEFSAADSKTDIRSFSGMASALYSDQALELFKVENRNVEADDFVITKWGKSNFLDIEETEKSMNGFCSEDSKPLAELALDSPKEEKPDNHMTPNLATVSSLTLTSNITKELETGLLSEVEENVKKLDNAIDEKHQDTNLALSAADRFCVKINQTSDHARKTSESGRDTDNVLKETGTPNGDCFAFADTSVHNGDHGKSDSQAIEYEACNSTNQLLENNTLPTATSLKSLRKADTVQMKRKQTGVTSRRSRRSKVADENLVKKDSAAVSSLGQRTPDDSMSKAVIEPGATDRVHEVNFVNEPFNLSSSNASGQNTKEDDGNGWSSIKHKLPVNNKSMTDILKRFSPEQLVVSKEIKERVERCLLKLPYLKSCNGMLCKHLQQKLTSCNLNYIKQTVRPPTKTYGRSSKDNPEQSTTSFSINQITSSVDGGNAGCIWRKHRYQVKDSVQKVNDSNEFKVESDEKEDLNFGKRRRLCRRRSRFKGFKYEVDTSDSMQTVNDNDDFMPLEDSSSGECSQSSAGDSIGVERDRLHLLTADRQIALLRNSGLRNLKDDVAKL